MNDSHNEPLSALPLCCALTGAGERFEERDGRWHWSPRFGDGCRGPRGRYGGAACPFIDLLYFTLLSRVPLCSRDWVGLECWSYNSEHTITNAMLALARDQPCLYHTCDKPNLAAGPGRGGTEAWNDLDQTSVTSELKC